MKIIATTLLVFVTSLSLFTACGKKGDSNAKPVISAVENKEMGFKMNVAGDPKPFKCDKDQCYYSKTLDEMVAIDIYISPALGTIKDIKDAVRVATIMGNKKILEQKTMPNGDLLVVKAPQGQIHEVWYWAKGKKSFLNVKCSGPIDRGYDLKALCSSLKNTK